jgi:hypothetical protein
MDAAKVAIKAYRIEPLVKFDGKFFSGKIIYL